MTDQEIVTWCSFCSRAPAEGELVFPDQNDMTMPVCDECMDNRDEKVLPVVMAMGEFENG